MPQILTKTLHFNSTYNYSFHGISDNHESKVLSENCVVWLLFACLFSFFVALSSTKINTIANWWSGKSVFFFLFFQMIYKNVWYKDLCFFFGHFCCLSTYRFAPQPPLYRKNIDRLWWFLNEVIAWFCNQKQNEKRKKKKKTEKSFLVFVWCDKTLIFVLNDFFLFVIVIWSVTIPHY